MGETVTDWAPIAGVSLERYVRITVGMLEDGVTDPIGISRFVAASGLSADQGEQARREWLVRIGRNVAVRNRYGELYRREGR
jgi:hypothetical protein